MLRWVATYEKASAWSPTTQLSTRLVVSADTALDARRLAADQFEQVYGERPAANGWALVTLEMSPPI